MMSERGCGRGGGGGQGGVGSRRSGRRSLALSLPEHCLQGTMHVATLVKESVKFEKEKMQRGRRQSGREGESVRVEHLQRGPAPRRAQRRAHLQERARRPRRRRAPRPRSSRPSSARRRRTSRSSTRRPCSQSARATRLPSRSPSTMQPTWSRRRTRPAGSADEYVLQLDDEGTRGVQGRVLSAASDSGCDQVEAASERGSVRQFLEEMTTSSKTHSCHPCRCTCRRRPAGRRRTR